MNTPPRLHDRVLLVQPEAELRAYTARLLAELGFRHVLQAPDAANARRLLEAARAKKHPVQLVVCDDSGGEALGVREMAVDVPCLLISDAANPRNVRLAARVGVRGMVFRPYGKGQLEEALAALN